MTLLRTRYKPDYFLLVLIVILVVAGLAILASASSELGRNKFNDSYYFLKHQLRDGLLVGAVGFIVAFFVNYQFYKKISVPIIFASIVLLVLVFTPLGLTVRNANRWVKIGPLSFQPSEILKITFIVYLSAWLSKTTGRREKSFTEGFLPFILMLGIIAALLVMQPATSTVAILLLSSLIVYFLSGAKIRYIVFTIGIGALALATLIFVTPYRMARLTTYLNSSKDTQGAGYHINQALIAIGSGGLTGIGYGQSTAKVSYLPTPTDDSIFAVAAQELGFLGAGTIIILFALLVTRLFWLAKKTKDRFGRLILVGFGSVLFLQSLVNMASISGLLPLTGVPLPFVSYGGTALAVFLTMMGIAVNISKHTSNPSQR